MHHLNNALRAHKLFRRDKDYIVKNGQVIIIDEFTGRMMEGRRYSDGLHQALEAKEHVKIQPENQTLASITFQNYFRLYKKLAGMTGTAATEADEFMNIYNLDVVEVPTNMPMIRARRGRCGLPDGGGEVQGDRRADQRVPGDAASRCWSARPRSRNRSVLAERLRKQGWKQLDSPIRTPWRRWSTPAHESKSLHDPERALPRAGGRIVAQAGMPGGVTIATNMAGRGTDIQLGGNVDMRIR